jgi:hypothetical protein
MEITGLIARVKKITIIKMMELMELKVTHNKP